MMRPQILAMHGLSMRDFKTQEEALATADELVAENKQVEGHPGGKMENLNPLLSKFWYVQPKGVKRSKCTTEASTWTKSTTEQKLALKDAGLAPEDAVHVKIENSAWPPFAHSKLDLRRILNQLVAQKNTCSALVAKFAVKAKSGDEHMIAQHKKLAAMMTTVNGFVDACEVKIAEATELTISSDAQTLEEATKDLETVIDTCGNHLKGAKDRWLNTTV